MQQGNQLPINTAAGYFKSEAEPDMGIVLLFSPLESRQLGHAKMIPATLSR